MLLTEAFSLSLHSVFIIQSMLESGEIGDNSSFELITVYNHKYIYTYLHERFWDPYILFTITMIIRTLCPLLLTLSYENCLYKSKKCPKQTTIFIWKLSLIR